MGDKGKYRMCVPTVKHGDGSVMGKICGLTWGWPCTGNAFAIGHFWKKECENIAKSRCEMLMGSYSKRIHSFSHFTLRSGKVPISLPWRCVFGLQQNFSRFCEGTRIIHINVRTQASQQNITQSIILLLSHSEPYPGSISSPGMRSTYTYMPIAPWSRSDQHRHSAPSAATQSHKQQTVMLWVFWHLSIRSNMNIFRNLCYSSSCVGLEH